MWLPGRRHKMLDGVFVFSMSSCDADCLDQSAGGDVTPTCRADAVKAACCAEAHRLVRGRRSDTGHEPEAPVTPAELGSANFLVITSVKIMTISPSAAYCIHQRL